MLSAPWIGDCCHAIAISTLLSCTVIKSDSRWAEGWNWRCLYQMCVTEKRQTNDFTFSTNISKHQQPKMTNVVVGLDNLSRVYPVSPPVSVQRSTLSRQSTVGQWCNLLFQRSPKLIPIRNLCLDLLCCDKSVKRHRCLSYSILHFYFIA